MKLQLSIALATASCISSSCFGGWRARFRYQSHQALAYVSGARPPVTMANCARNACANSPWSVAPQLLGLSTMTSATIQSSAGTSFGIPAALPFSYRALAIAERRRWRRRRRGAASGCFPCYFRDLGGRFAHHLGDAGLHIGRQRDELLHAGAQLLAQRRGKFDLLGDKLGRRLRGKDRVALCEAPLEVIARNGVLVTASALDGFQAFLLRLQRRRKGCAESLKDGLRIESWVAHGSSLIGGIGTAGIIAHFVCSAR